ncbi:hypothetical protein SNEBB_010902 [Seison nebaliae]|nr:hypothetical protein SNEBB_010902 [Seison nebaliae]
MEGLRYEFVEYDTDFLDVNTMTDMYDLLTEKLGYVNFEDPMNRGTAQMDEEQNLLIFDSTDEINVTLTTTSPTIIEHKKNIDQIITVPQLSLDARNEMPALMMDDNYKKDVNGSCKDKNKKKFQNFFKLNGKKKKSIANFLRKLKDVRIDHKAIIDADSCSKHGNSENSAQPVVEEMVTDRIRLKDHGRETIVELTWSRNIKLRGRRDYVV